MKIYRYNSGDDYLHHVKELQKQGIDWSSGASEETYAKFYLKYEKFLLFVHDNNRLSYGSPRSINEDDPEPILYMRKNTNLNNY